MAIVVQHSPEGLADSVGIPPQQVQFFLQQQQLRNQQAAQLANVFQGHVDRQRADVRREEDWQRQLQLLGRSERREDALRQQAWRREDQIFERGVQQRSQQVAEDHKRRVQLEEDLFRVRHNLGMDVQADSNLREMDAAVRQAGMTFGDPQQARTKMQNLISEYEKVSRDPNVQAMQPQEREAALRPIFDEIDAIQEALGSARSEKEANQQLVNDRIVETPWGVMFYNPERGTLEVPDHRGAGEQAKFEMDSRELNNIRSGVVELITMETGRQPTSEEVRQGVLDEFRNRLLMKHDIEDEYSELQESGALSPGADRSSLYPIPTTPDSTAEKAGEEVEPKGRSWFGNLLGWRSGGDSEKQGKAEERPEGTVTGVGMPSGERWQGPRAPIGALPFLPGLPFGKSPHDRPRRETGRTVEEAAWYDTPEQKAVVDEVIAELNAVANEPGFDQGRAERTLSRVRKKLEEAGIPAEAIDSLLELAGNTDWYNEAALHEVQQQIGDGNQEVQR